MTTLVIIFAWATFATMAYFTSQIARDPAASLGKIMHDTPELPRALLVRYIGTTLLALFVALTGNIAAITAMFAAYAVIGLGDAWVYKSVGKPFTIHLFGGGSAAFGTLIGLAALS